MSDHHGAALNDGKPQYSKRLTWVIIRIAWGAMSYAYSGSIIGTTLGQPSFINYMGLATNPNAASLTGATTALFYVGGIFGCLLNSWMADRFGRKITVATACAFQLIASACLAGSVNIAMFIVFRFVNGLGAYMLYLTAPMWTVELVPPKNRSILAGMNGLFGVVGYILAAYVGVGFFYYDSTTSSQWRAPLAIGCFPALLLLLMIPWLPESPRWLLLVNREEKAWEIVRDLHASPHDVEHEYAGAEFSQMKAQFEIDRSLSSSWISIARRPSYRKRALIAFALPVILYSTGNLVITTYAASIFAQIGYNAAQSINLLAGTYLAAIVGNLISLTYIDRVPRNVILSVGVLLTTVIMSTYTGLVATYLGSSNTSALSAAAAMLFLFLVAFNLTMEGPSWYYASEIFPTHLRAKGMTIAVIAFCIIDILWLALAPTATKTIGWRYYLVFICVSIPGAVVVYTTFPDTLGKPLEEIAQLFGDDDLVAVYAQDNEVDSDDPAQAKGKTDIFELVES